MKGGEKREGNDGELRLMSHYWQVVRKREKIMNQESNDNGGKGEWKTKWGKDEIERREGRERKMSKKRSWVREHLWPLAVKVSGCLSSAPLGAGSTRALIRHWLRHGPASTTAVIVLKVFMSANTCTLNPSWVCFCMAIWKTFLLESSVRKLSYVSLK